MDSKDARKPTKTSLPSPRLSNYRFLESRHSGLGEPYFASHLADDIAVSGRERPAATEYRWSDAVLNFARFRLPQQRQQQVHVLVEVRVVDAIYHFLHFITV